MKKIKKILLIRFSSIGDIVLCSPVIRCTKTKYPNAEIHFITKKDYAGILEHNPHISKCISIDKDINATIPSLKKENYDIIIDLHKNLRSLRLRSRLRAKPYTFKKLNIKKWLFTNFKINLLPKKHIVDRYFEGIKPLGIKNDNMGLDYFISNDTKNPIIQKKYIAFAIGAKFITKIMPPEILTNIIKEIDYEIILLGGKTDVNNAKEIIKLNPNKEIINYCGRLSLDESAAVIKNALAVVSNDTGLMHIASAFSKRIVSVWGNTVPDFGMYPYMPTLKINENWMISEVKNLKCRPCSKIGYDKCPKKHFDCMYKQNVNKIISFLHSN
jgi:ADP-heptose:LPS heptosyltransferase